MTWLATPPTRRGAHDQAADDAQLVTGALGSPAGHASPTGHARFSDDRPAGGLVGPRPRGRGRSPGVEADQGKPVVRRGRKARGLARTRDGSAVSVKPHTTRQGGLLVTLH